jgi:hypothetical protein
MSCYILFHLSSFSGNNVCEAGESSCSVDCGPFELAPRFSWPGKDMYNFNTNALFDVEAVNDVILSGISFRVGNVDFGKARFTVLL